ncbi:FecR family protein [Dyadobacter fermentans]|uniref:Anti-FecI sigma factor, FecR n=1 Tax=Dyadobacter fermentans (strain ATCC 700827 / DSM 18053 / CIP 107007 / KCTC 52180 / NS114) TaxID=471854 RepID=C6W1C0_DYAFD|nr:FecR family protein [Dyadobacter fermentans]ACT91977.1 anti-FecI sigma factor, FecR [Dyadobacter fermentans DSM 18053]
MELSKARELIQKYKDGTLTPTEKSILESWYLDLARSETTPIDAETLESHLDEVWNALPVHPKPEVKPGSTIPLYRRIAAAASVILVLGAGAYFFYAGQEDAAPVAEAVAPADVAPGESKAVLTLADGAEIVLDSIVNGQLAKEGNTSIVKTNPGEIMYKPSGTTGPAAALTYNTITTPKAGQFQVRLPDGTKVWLNAESSVRFPTAFTGRERVVEIMGEVYFEVAKMTVGQRKVPFKVLAGKQMVEVLGTRFNINSYQDEGIIKTTLLEGSIQVRESGNANGGVLLRPGQQAELAAAGKARTDGKKGFDVKTVNAGAVVAWKDGYFRFDNVGLPELMRQLARWYDMDVVYRAPAGEHEFVGQIARSAPLSKVLKILEMGDVHFRVEGKTIIVTE